MVSETAISQIPFRLVSVLSFPGSLQPVNKTAIKKKVQYFI
jgi:hypothetical protein